MKRRLYTLLCVAATLCAAPLLAVEPTTASGESDLLTLHDCMAYALSHATRMQIRQAERDDARIARRDAVLAAFAPQINASTYAYYNFGRSIDPQTNTYFTQTSFHNNYGLSVGFDLFNGFTAVNNLRISRTGMLIAASAEEQAEADICLAVMEAYYNVVYYTRLAEIYAEQAATAERSLRKAQRQEELGQKGHADVIQLEADLADRQYELINMRNLLADQRMILSDLLFWPTDRELRIDTELPAGASERIGSAATASADEAVDYALEHHPGVQMAGWQVDQARRELSTAKWSLLPSVALYAGWSTSYYTYQGSRTDRFGAQFRNNGGEFVEVALSIPLFGRLQGHSRIARKRHALTRATAEYEQKRREVESEVRRAMQDRDGAAAAWTQAERKSAVQQEAYALNLRKLEQGLISPLEFQTANSNYLKAQADAMNSLFQYRIKQAVVRYYNGENYLEQ